MIIITQFAPKHGLEWKEQQPTDDCKFCWNAYCMCVDDDMLVCCAKQAHCIKRIWVRTRPRLIFNFMLGVFGVVLTFLLIYFPLWTTKRAQRQKKGTKPDESKRISSVCLFFFPVILCIFFWICLNFACVLLLLLALFHVHIICKPFGFICSKQKISTHRFVVPVKHARSYKPCIFFACFSSRSSTNSI